MSATEQRGLLAGIARCIVARTPMERLVAARVTTQAGVEGDLRGKPGPRQVTVIAEAGWRAACAQLAANLEWTTRRANLLVSGLDLQDTRGTTIRIGDLILEVCDELKPCALMDYFHQGLRAALSPQWRGGVSCRVAADGEIRVGDPVVLQRA